MSWGYPPYHPSTSLVLDMERFSDNLWAFSQETDGNLNEHNFSTSTLPDLATDDHIGADLGIKAFRAVEALAPDSTAYPLRFATEWTPVADVPLSFTCPAGKLFVICSFQYSNVGSLLLINRIPGAVFCLEIDGAPQFSSLLGAGDVSNEYTVNETAVAPGIDYDSSPSFRGTFEPHQVTGTFTVGAGNHTVRLLYRNLLSLVATTDYQFMQTREMICLWMWA